MSTGSKEDSEGTAKEGATVSGRFLLLLVAGFVLVFVGITVILVAAVLFGGGSASGGVVIFIGPFPIVIGTGPDFTSIGLLSIIIAVLSVVLFLFMRRRVRLEN